MNVRATSLASFRGEVRCPGGVPQCCASTFAKTPSPRGPPRRATGHNHAKSLDKVQVYPHFFHS